MSGLEGVTICADVQEGPNHPICKIVGASPKILGRLWRPPKNGFVKKTLFTHSRECEKSKRRVEPMETTRQRGNFKVNYLVLVRDLTSGTFAPCYMPNYRIVAIHSPNRITVRDEKGTETVRRASHLKMCDWKQKVTSMVSDQGEYDKFGRSTKLLLHPKDITNVQFDRKTDNKGNILPEAENSVIKVNATASRGKCSEISPEHLAIKASSDTSTNNEILVETLDLCEEIWYKNKCLISVNSTLQVQWKNA